MRKVIYKIGAFETTSFAEKTAYEKLFHKKAEVVLRDVVEERPEMTPLRKEMMERYGKVYLNPKAVW